MQITIHDLNVAAQLIDIAQQRGAYKADEASAVGEVYTKLVSFIKATQESMSTETSTEADGTESESVSDSETESSVASAA
jgi:hypothetical protein